MNRFLLHLLSASSLTAFTTPALAQEGSNPDANSNEALDSLGDEIIVTAQRREQALSDVGLSISAIGGDALQQRNVTNAADLAKLVPGFSVSDSGFSTPIYTLRGVGINEPSAGSSSSVAVYVDEVPLAYPVITQGAAIDLRRVEVLKGPQGTLYGQNSTGGAVNYIANKPTNELEAGVTGTSGRFNRAQVEGFISGPLSSTVRARLAVRGSVGDEWQRSISRDDQLGKVKNLTGRAIIEWEPSERFRATFNVNGWLDGSDTQAAQLVQITPSNPARALPSVLNAPLSPAKSRAADWGPGDGFDRDDEFWQSSVRAELDVSDEVQLVSITAYSNFDREQLVDSDGIGAATNNHQGQSSEIRSLSQELRLSGDVGGINWVVGGNASDDRATDVLTQNLRDLSSLQSLLGFPVNGSISNTAQKIRNWAIFGNVDVTITDRLILTGGIRYSQETRTFRGCAAPLDAQSAVAYTNFVNFFRGNNSLSPVPLLAPGQCYSFYGSANGAADDTAGLPLFTPGLANRRLRENNVPWNVGLSFKPTEDSLIYTRVSRGYKSGNFATLGLIDNALYGPIVQEKLMAYEIGARASVNRLLQVEGALFRYDYDDKQLRARINSGPPFGNVGAQDNIPESRITGAEFAVTLRPVAGLTLSGSGVYLESKILEYTGFTVLGTTARDLSGSPFNFTPKWSLNGDINYSTPVSDVLDAFVGLNAAYRGKTSAVFAPPDDTTLSAFDIDKYTLLDAQLGIESSDGTWKAFMWGKNLTNKYYWTNVIKGADVVIRYAGMPVTFGVTASHKF